VRTRRRFLTTVGHASLGFWAATSNPQGAFAQLEPDALVLETLTRMARLIYPHDKLSDAVYATIVVGLLEDPQNASVLSTGVASLGNFLNLDEARQIATLEQIDDGPFFNAVKTPVMWAIYNAPELWALIDYPGPSFQFGGYINRGFDDIDWLPTA
jgi:hypothetical protein